MESTSGLQLPTSLLRRLRFRAKRDNRSMQSELIHCLYLGLQLKVEPESFLEQARRLRQQCHGVLTEEIYEETLNDGHP
ncbi:MAG: Arc family DNA-binding protein [Verrucomicrobiota bacterium]